MITPRRIRSALTLAPPPCHRAQVHSITEPAGIFKLARDEAVLEGLRTASQPELPIVLWTAEREVLLQAEMVPEQEPRPQPADGAQALKLTAAIALGGGAATAVAWALLEFGA